jgi:hypothetical protein
MEADGSAAGAGGIGAASPAAGAGAAPSAGAPALQPPQQLVEPQQLEPQPPWQPLCFLNRLDKKLQRFFLQQLSQELQQLDCSQQAGSQAGCSQQVGCSQQAASQQVGWPQP